MKEYKVTLDNGHSATFDNVPDLKRQLVFLAIAGEHYVVTAKIKGAN